MKMSCKRDVESYTFHRSLRSGTKVQVQSTFGGGYTQQFPCARFGTIYRLGKGSVYPFAFVNMAKKRRLKRFELDTIWPIRLAFVFLFFFFVGHLLGFMSLSKKFSRVLPIKGIHAK